MFISLKEAAKKLDVCYNSAYSFVRRGMLPAYRIGKDYKVDIEELDEFIKGKKFKGVISKKGGE